MINFISSKILGLHQFKIISELSYKSILRFFDKTIAVFFKKPAPIIAIFNYLNLKS